MNASGIKVHVRTDLMGGLDYDGVNSGLLMGGSEGDSPLGPSLPPRNGNYDEEVDERNLKALAPNVRGSKSYQIFKQ